MGISKVTLGGSYEVGARRHERREPQPRPLTPLGRR